MCVTHTLDLRAFLWHDFTVTSRQLLRELEGLPASATDPWPAVKASVPPNLRLTSGALRWDYRGAQRDVKDTGGMLDAFRRIRDADGVLRFARKYGVLRLCAHGLPAEHSNHLPPTERCKPIGFPRVAEPVDVWLGFTEEARRLMDLAETLSAEHVSEVEWQKLAAGSEGGYRRIALLPRKDRLFAARQRLAQATNRWLLLGDPRPRFQWEAARPTLVIEAGTFGLLALQLAAAMSGTAGLAVCSGCARTYERKGRKAQAGRRNYCEECRSAGVPDRERHRFERERLHEKRAREKKVAQQTSAGKGALG